MLYPLIFTPIFKERIWGSESWTISDRPGDESIITNGPLAGTSLRALMARDAKALVGDAAPVSSGRFPILCKILTCRETLSVQVHPPAAFAAELGGEPKTEMWYIADADPGAELYVGLKRDVARGEFERRLADGSVADALHRIPVSAGDSMFLPSGRVHAIGAGLVIFEIQQNSDTTYRVFDWNRAGLDGKPRELHITESLASINFDDAEPRLANEPAATRGTCASRPLVRDPLFDVDLVKGPGACDLKGGALRIVAAVQGPVRVHTDHADVEIAERGFCLVPAALGEVTVTVGGEALVVEAGQM